MSGAGTLCVVLASCPKYREQTLSCIENQNVSPWRGAGATPSVGQRSMWPQGSVCLPEPQRTAAAGPPCPRGRRSPRGCGCCWGAGKRERPRAPRRGGKGARLRAAARRGRLLRARYGGAEPVRRCRAGTAVLSRYGGAELVRRCRPGAPGGARVVLRGWAEPLPLPDPQVIRALFPILLMFHTPPRSWQKEDFAVSSWDCWPFFYF